MQDGTVNALQDKLARVDAEIYKLMTIRNKLLRELELATEANTMQERGKMLSDILRKAYTLTDPSMTSIYIEQYVLPWRHYLSRQYFPETLKAIPESMPSNWNRMESSILLFELSEALRRDRAAMPAGRG